MCNLILSSNKLFEELYFHHVEKIKTIGSCYMAASGLAPDKQVGDFSVCGLISFCLISFALICGTCYDIISLHETVCLSLSPPEINGWMEPPERAGFVCIGDAGDLERDY